MNKVHPIFQPSCPEPSCGDEGRLCEECAAKEMKAHEYLRHAAPPEDSQQYRDAMRDAGRGHLLR